MPAPALQTKAALSPELVAALEQQADQTNLLEASLSAKREQLEQVQEQLKVGASTRTRCGWPRCSQGWSRSHPVGMKGAPQVVTHRAS